MMSYVFVSQVKVKHVYAGAVLRAKTVQTGQGTHEQQAKALPQRSYIIPEPSYYVRCRVLHSYVGVPIA